MKKYNFFCVLLILLFVNTVVDAQVKVKGYFKKNGTYVKPHYRSKPDGNPFNNYSFPGNINPYTGKVAPGKVGTYLKNYYDKKSYYYVPNADNDAYPVANPDTEINKGTSLYCSSSTLYTGYYFSGVQWYYDSNCTKPATNPQHTPSNQIQNYYQPQYQMPKYSNTYIPRNLIISGKVKEMAPKYI